MTLNRTLFAASLLLAFALPALAQPDFLPPSRSFEQWSQWEMQANTARFRKTGNVEAKVVMVPASEVIIDADPNISEAIKRYFIRGDQVMFPLHPHNTSSEVPFQDRAEVERWTISPTASRSVVHWDPYFTIEMPTDHPHGPTGQLQSGKVQLYKSVIVSRARSEHIRAVDSRIGGEAEMGIMHDVLTIRAVNGGNGFVVRDLSEMRANHYYVPGFSIPYIGHQIAAANNMEFEEFWTKHDAEIYGRLKAQMLLRYGLWFETPNAQNRLIELDANLKPTGRILIRDLSDSLMHSKISRAIGAEQALTNDIREGVAKTDPRGDNSYWQMDEAPNVSRSTVNNWVRVHEEAFAKELTRVLGVPIARGEWNREIPEEGLRKLREWHDAQRGGEGFARTRRGRGMTAILGNESTGEITEFRTLPEVSTELEFRSTLPQPYAEAIQTAARALLAFEGVREGALARLEERIAEAPNAETRAALETKRAGLKTMQLQIDNTTDILAEHRAGKVVISTGLLDELDARARASNKPLLPERMLALILGHEAAHASGIVPERVADAEGIRILERSPVGLPIDAEIKETLRAFDRPTGYSHLDNLLNRLRSLARYGTPRGRIAAMERAAAGEADAWADFRRADGTLKWRPLLASGTLNQVKGTAHFALALFLKEVAIVYQTGDRARIEEFFDALTSLDFYKHYGMFVAGARMGQAGYNRFLQRYVKPGFVNSLLKTNVVLAAGIALPMIVNGDFTKRTFAVSVGSLGLSSLLVQGGMNRLAWVMKLEEARKAGILAKLAGTKFASVSGWFYTAAQLAVVLYIAENIEKPLNAYYDLQAEKVILADAGRTFTQAVSSSDATAQSIQDAADAHHQAWIDYRNYLFTPLDAVDATFADRMAKLGREAKIQADARRAAMANLAKQPALREDIQERGFASLRDYVQHLLAKDDQEIRAQVNVYVESYNLNRDQHLNDIYRTGQRDSEFLADVPNLDWILRGAPAHDVDDPTQGRPYVRAWHRYQLRRDALSALRDAYEDASPNRLQAYDDEAAILAATAAAMREVGRNAEAKVLEDKRVRVLMLKSADNRLVNGDGMIEAVGGPTTSVAIGAETVEGATGPGGATGGIDIFRD